MEVSDLKYMLNLGTAKIVSALIQDFASVSAVGKLQVTLESTVEFTAEYAVSVTFDSQLIFPLDQKSYSIPARGTKTIEWEVKSSNHDPQTHRATIYLKNAVGEVLDTEEIEFTTTKTHFENDEKDLDSIDTTAGDQWDDDFENGTLKVANEVCLSMCPDWMKLGCVMLGFCDVQIQTVITFLFVMVVLVFVCGLCLRRCKETQKVGDFCTCCLFKKKDKKGKGGDRKAVKVNIELNSGKKDERVSRGSQKRVNRKKFVRTIKPRRGKSQGA
jgi:hypothetical protein